MCVGFPSLLRLDACSLHDFAPLDQFGAQILAELLWGHERCGLYACREQAVPHVGKREDAYASVVNEYARRVDAFARAHPLDYCGWRGGTYDEEEPAPMASEGEPATL